MFSTHREGQVRLNDVNNICGFDSFVDKVPTKSRVVPFFRIFEGMGLGQCKFYIPADRFECLSEHEGGIAEVLIA